MSRSTATTSRARAWVARWLERRRVAGPLLVAYLLVVALIVFWPTADVASSSVLTLWSVLDRVGLGFVPPVVVELVTNVLLFMPLSFLGASFRPRWSAREWLLVGLAGTVFIELTQMLLLPGRSPALTDIAANTLGALLGYGVRVAVR